MYQLQAQVNEKNLHWIDTLLKGRFMSAPELQEDFMTEWRTLLLKQELLISLYKNKEKVLEDCS